MKSATTNFKLYLNKIMDTIPDEIHNQLWEHLIECIAEKTELLLEKWAAEQSLAAASRQVEIDGLVPLSRDQLYIGQKVRARVKNQQGGFYFREVYIRELHHPIVVGVSRTMNSKAEHSTALLYRLLYPMKSDDETPQ